ADIAAGGLGHGVSKRLSARIIGARCVGWVPCVPRTVAVGRPKGAQTRPVGDTQCLPAIRTQTRFEQTFGLPLDPIVSGASFAPLGGLAHLQRHSVEASGLTSHRTPSYGNSVSWLQAPARPGMLAPNIDPGEAQSGKATCAQRD